MTRNREPSPLARLPLVVGMNGVDKISPEEWDERLNAPSPAQEESIRRRCADVAARLRERTGLGATQVEFYSALKRYHLVPLMTAVMRHAVSGVRMAALQPKDPWDLADPEARAFAEQERARKYGRKQAAQSFDRIWEEMAQRLPAAEVEKLRAAYRRETARPPRLAMLGKAGVGKSTTVNVLTGAQFKVSHVLPGTSQAQLKEFVLPGGGLMQVVDLPGYGRSVNEDSASEAIYREVLPGCDLVLLVMQANARDLSDDEEIIARLAEWLKAAPATP